MVAEIASVRILSAEPDLSDIVIAPVLIDLSRRNMAVIIDDWQLL